MAKFNMSNEKTPMSLLDAHERSKNFFEVSLGYTEAEALTEAARCLGCKEMPCMKGCPVNIPIPRFIEKIKEGDFEGAYNVISEFSSLPAVCGRVCPQESQCEKNCVRGIKGESVAIGRLERFVADVHNAKDESEASSTAIIGGSKVAVIGSGPSGLTCAGDLAKLGHKVTVFEALHTFGGVLVYGIPEFRLPKIIVAKEIDNLKSLGVEFIKNVIIGKTITVDGLFNMGYDAIYVASGAGLPSFMGIEGETLSGVMSANEFLTRVNLMKAYEDGASTPIKRGGVVAVVGGGNVAMDAARCALRLGADKVYVIYRRSEAELPARREEVEHAKEEGACFMTLTNPVKIIGNGIDDRRDPGYGFIGKLECIKMELGEPDAGGRRSPMPIRGSEFTLDVDTVIMAIGTSPNPLIKSTTEGLEVNRRGGITIDPETGATSIPGVYAGGDAVTGSATVISAMGAGKVAAAAIDKYLKKHKI